MMIPCLVQGHRPYVVKMLSCALNGKRYNNIWAYSSKLYRLGCSKIHVGSCYFQHFVAKVVATETVFMAQLRCILWLNSQSESPACRNKDLYCTPSATVSSADGHALPESRSKQSRSPAVIDKKLSYRRGTAQCACQLKSCQLPRNSAEATCTTSPKPSISCR